MYKYVTILCTPSPPPESTKLYYYNIYVQYYISSPPPEPSHGNQSSVIRTTKAGQPTFLTGCLERRKGEA